MFIYIYCVCVCVSYVSTVQREIYIFYLITPCVCCTYVLYLILFAAACKPYIYFIVILGSLPNGKKETDLGGIICKTGSNPKYKINLNYCLPFSTMAVYITTNPLLFNLIKCKVVKIENGKKKRNEILNLIFVIREIEKSLRNSNALSF